MWRTFSGILFLATAAVCGGGQSIQQHRPVEFHSIPWPRPELHYIWLNSSKQHGQHSCVEHRQLGSASPITDPPLPMKYDSPPGMIQSTSGSLSSGCNDDKTMSSNDKTECSLPDQPTANGESFNEQVYILPIPPSQRISFNSSIECMPIVILGLRRSMDLTAMSG